MKAKRYIVSVTNYAFDDDEAIATAIYDALESDSYDYFGNAIYGCSFNVRPYNEAK